LVAAGLSLILGLMDVLNLAHGELFMLGAYVGWTAYVRPDTLVDVATPLGLLAVGFVLLPALNVGLGRVNVSAAVGRIWPWLALLLGGALLLTMWPRYAIAIWNPAEFALSPGTFSLALDQGPLALAPAPSAGVGVRGGFLVAGLLVAAAVAGWQLRRTEPVAKRAIPRGALYGGGGVLVVAVLLYLFNDGLTEYLLNMNTFGRFLLAMGVATAVGFLLGGLIEMTLVRPLYDRPIYQLMLTLGLSFIGIELVRAVWGRPEFTMPKPAVFSGSGAGCPAESVGDWLEFGCSTMRLFGARIRTYNEIFVIAVGLIVLIGVWILLQRTRLGMIIRAGVQDAQMVEALGINVRRVFTMVFALGVGLASLGGILAAPSVGLSNDMGTRLLLLALIALAIGGLTSFPGAAAGAILVGLIQQFMVKYGQLGIPLPFLAEPFKPSPPLVPASTILLMVIILLVLPHGLFGREE
jgi:branched-chain amino acid transport system permease protein